MSRAAARIRNAITWVHRWLGVGLCVLFAVWFLSGFVMMYADFPKIDSALRLAKADPLDAGQIRLSPEEARARVKDVKTPDRVIMTMLDGRPVFRFVAGRGQSIVFADNGDLLAGLSEDMARRVAAAWTRQPIAAARFEGVIREADQWTVNGIFRTHGALMKYAWPDGQETYVSPLTAEVVQHTTRSSRIGAYAGAIPHWIYFAPLRRNGPLWGKVVIGVSAIGTFVSLLGMIIGLSRYSPSKRYRTADGSSSFPYSGQKRWHAVLGLVFGTFACTWAFSGMMSMDPFPGLAESAPAAQRFRKALRGPLRRMGAFADRDPREALAIAAALKVKELEFASFLGEPSYLATEAPTRSLIVPVHGSARAMIDEPRLVAVLAQAGRPDELHTVRPVTEYESYYVDRHNRLPLPVIFIQLNDPGRSMYYIDPRTARIVESYGSLSRWDRWMYRGLHSLDLPWLYRLARLGTW